MSELRRICKMARNLVGRPRITKLWIEVTDNCNSRCSTCNIWKKRATENPLTPEEITIILSDPVFENVDYIINSGGEPTTREDLFEFIRAEHLALPSARLQISTNGLEPDRLLNVVELLLEMYPDLSLDIGTSLDGIGNEHDSIRGIEGNYDSVICMLENLKKMRDEKYGRRLGIGFGTVVTDRTTASIPELSRYAAKNNFGYLIQWYNESPFYSNRRGNPGDKETIIETVRNADYTITSDMWVSWCNGKPIQFNCMALRSFCVLKCNGDIVPCLTLWDRPVGNVRKNPPTFILTYCHTDKQLLKICGGCLNSWATYWSFESDPKQYIWYFSKHPIKLIKKLVK